VANDSGRLTNLMSQKYEQKRWYAPPTDEMYAEARRANVSSAGDQKGFGSVAISGMSKPIYQVLLCL
jgi:hypothetical protein